MSIFEELAFFCHCDLFANTNIYNCQQHTQASYINDQFQISRYALS